MIISMKFNKLTSLSVSLIAGLFLFACEKDEDQVTFLGGTDPVLTVSSVTTMALTKEQENYTSLQFQWTNPTFEFSNGVNTQDVFYTLQIDTLGSDFSNPKVVELAYPRELATTFKVRDLNTALSGMELKDFIPHNFEFRVKAALANSPVTVYSNVIGITITTYLDVVYPVPDKLFITGAATPAGWMGGGDAPVATQEFTKINAYTFQITSLQINGASPFLFVPVYGNWDNKYGFTGEKEKNNATSDSFKPEGNDFLSPATSKAYKITVNFKTGKFSFE
jgi:hypothetical protein